MKRIILCSALVMLSLITTSAYAYDIAIENADGVTVYYNYINDGQELEVTCQYDNYGNPLSSYTGVVAIPEEMTYNSRILKVTRIGEYAFYECYGLTSVTIPNSVMSIGDMAFFACSSLTSVTIGNSVKSIGGGVFRNCSGLTSVTIPNSVTSIENQAFYGCSGLTSISIPNGVKSIGNSVFAYCSGLTSVTIPNSVTSIWNGAFYGCSGLTSVTIPGSVTDIGREAFNGCDLESVFSLIEEPFVIYGKAEEYKRIFSLNTFNNATLYVPAGTIDKYKATDGWKDFASIEEVGGTSEWTSWAPWNSAGTANYVFTIFWDSDDNISPFTYRQNVVSPNLYQYKMSDWAYGVELVLDYNATTGHVTCAPTYTGYEMNTYGQLYVADYNTYLSEVRGQEIGVDFEPRYGTFDQDEGIITIPLTYFVSAGKLGSGYEYIYINGYIRHDVSCSISYNGKITEDDGSVFVSADVEFGADVTSALVALVSGNLTDEVKAAIIAGDYENIVEISESGEVKFPATDMADGTYTFVVVTYINGQAKNIATDTFNYVVVDPVWKSLGWCKYTEDCLGPLYRDADDDPLNYVRTYEVEIQEEENHPGLYRLVNPYGEAYPFNDPGDWDTSRDYYMEINACDPEGVFIEAQKMGVNWGQGEFSICSLGAYNMANGTSFDEVKASGVMGKLENGIITFPKNGLLAKIGDHGWYSGNTTASFKIVLPDTTHQEEPTYYRHFIEEGKVWKVGDDVWHNNNTAHRIKYCYFEGDTVISGRKCKMMWCRHENPNVPPSTSFMGSLYENAGRVYLVLGETRDFKLIYDFATKEGQYFEIYDRADHIDFDIIQATITKRFTLMNEFYKGPCYTVSLKKPWGEDMNGNMIYQDVEETWMGGVGSQYLPLDNCALRYGDNNKLMSCTVGDEVLYRNRNIIDGVTPDEGEVKKNTIDFTHVVKSQPKAPRREGSADEETLTGEYSMKELFVNFKPLAGPYVITICNDSGTEVYRKEVQTSNVIGLNTDISGYAPGEYTITVENDAEAYTASINIDEEVGIGRPTPDPSLYGGEKAGAVFDLSGRQIVNSKSSNGKLNKGIYIRDGRKVVVR